MALNLNGDRTLVRSNYVNNLCLLNEDYDKANAPVQLSYWKPAFLAQLIDPGLSGTFGQLRGAKKLR
jgi:hypothetical protein